MDLDKLLTRRRNSSYSGHQENVRSRRSSQVRVVPLARAATPSWLFPGVPDTMIILKIGRCAPAHGLRYQYLLESDYSGVLMPYHEQARNG